MTDKTRQTIKRLRNKANSDKDRMPSIGSIAMMFDDLGIDYQMRDSQNIVEHRSAGNRYVNSRHAGKKGKKLTVDTENGVLELDSSCSYYSWNTWSYAKQLLEIIDKH